MTTATPAAAILLVEDDLPTRSAIATFLRGHGHPVEDVGDATSAVEAWRAGRPDLIVLDLGLPDRDGLTVIRYVRREASTPILVLSARDAEADKVTALDQGADDYVTKPFGMDEFLARLRAAVRRGAAASDTDEPVVETDSFTVDLAAKKVTKNGAEVHLTPTEWGMLEMLVRNRGKLVGREELLKEVWGPAYAKETHYLRVYLAQLRRKLEDDPSHPRHLLTEAGMGYRFEA